MERIRIGKNGAEFDIENIIPVSQHILKLIFVNDAPSNWNEDIYLYTEGGYLATVLTGFYTVYRVEDKTIYLSNDESVYTEPEEGVDPLPPEPYVPTLEELKAAKKREVAAQCETTIYHGVDVVLDEDNVEHFSLTEHDQLNLFGKQSQLAAGVEQLEYHADGQPCRYYSADEMRKIIEAAMWHVSYHTTYCNALNMWIAGVETQEELDAIYYGAEVPEAYCSEVLTAYLVKIAAME